MNSMRRRKTRTYTLALVAIVISAITSCEFWTPKLPTEIGDGGFLSENPCGPPCFMGITPGITSESTALKIIAEFFDLKECSSWEATPDGVQKGIRCKETLAILFDDANNVAAVSFKPQQTITVDEAISRFGTPDAVGVAPLISDYESPTVSMLIYYHEYKMSLFLPEQQRTDYELTSDTKIETIMYSSEYNYSLQVRDVQDWKGMGLY